ncbi:hypothetical protein D3C73_1595420 [compost metagenome]
MISFTLQKLLLRAERRLLRYETGNSSQGRTFVIRKGVSRRRLLTDLGASKGGAG